MHTKQWHVYTKLSEWLRKRARDVVQCFPLEDDLWCLSRERDLLRSTERLLFGDFLHLSRDRDLLPCLLPLECDLMCSASLGDDLRIEDVTFVLGAFFAIKAVACFN